MKQDVILTFTTQLHHEDEQEIETVELVSQGQMWEKGQDSYQISYEESEMTGSAATTTTILVEKEFIYLQRSGAVTSNTTFQRGKRHQAAYNTPYGATSMEVYTRVLRHNITMAGGEIYLEYDMKIAQNIISKNFFKLQITLPKPRAL